MWIDGKAIAQLLRAHLRQEILSLHGRKPCLAAVLIGDNPASHLYVRSKMRACEEVGMLSRPYFFPEATSLQELTDTLALLREDPEVDGILVQLPLPAHLPPLTVAERIDPHKDVDAAHPIHLGKLLLGDPTGFVPCTPLGIQRLFMHLSLELSGKHVVIAGRSNIVGKPLALLLMQKQPFANATVTVVHSHSKQLKELVREADVLIAAIGSPHFFTKEMIRPGTIVIDVGQNKIPDATRKEGMRLVGDVDTLAVAEVASWITPVPGGVGPMTIAMLLENTLTAYRKSLRNLST